jgi:hypothetical protein
MPTPLIGVYMASFAHMMSCTKPSQKEGLGPRSLVHEIMPSLGPRLKGEGLSNHFDY